MSKSVIKLNFVRCTKVNFYNRKEDTSYMYRYYCLNTSSHPPSGIIVIIFFSQIVQIWSVHVECYEEGYDNLYKKV